MADKAKKAAAKEGGKKGQDIAGLSDMGGVKFFTLALENCNGEFELLQEAMDAMNKEVDEAAEDRKGGAGNLGKLLLSANDKHVGCLFHVPKELQEEKGMSLDDWVKSIMEPTGGKILEKDETTCKATIEGDPTKERFPLKLRDLAISCSFGELKKRMLVVDDDDDDDYVNYAEAAGVEW
eukprot:m.109954 g.109954  ORF g.109954 m.109954 type:complete len:180 (+) comp19170_c3_seq1:90-629(+)